MSKNSFISMIKVAFFRLFTDLITNSIRLQTQTAKPGHEHDKDKRVDVPSTLAALGWWRRAARWRRGARACRGCVRGGGGTKESSRSDVGQATAPAAA